MIVILFTIKLISNGSAKKPTRANVGDDIHDASHCRLGRWQGALQRCQVEI